MSIPPSIFFLFSPDERSWRSLGDTSLDDPLAETGAVERTFCFDKALEIDRLRGKPTGRILVYDPRSRPGASRVVARDLFCPTGVAICEDPEDPGTNAFLLVAERWKRRLVRLDLTTGEPTIFVEGLPAVPDVLAVVDAPFSRSAAGARGSAPHQYVQAATAAQQYAQAADTTSNYDPPRAPPVAAPRERNGGAELQRAARELQRGSPVAALRALQTGGRSSSPPGSPPRESSFAPSSVPTSDKDNNFMTSLGLDRLDPYLPDGGSFADIKTFHEDQPSLQAPYVWIGMTAAPEHQNLRFGQEANLLPTRQDILSSIGNFIADRFFPSAANAKYGYLEERGEQTTQRGASSAPRSLSWRGGHAEGIGEATGSLACKLSTKNGDLLEFFHDAEGRALGTSVSTVLETTGEGGSRVLLFGGGRNCYVAKLAFSLSERIAAERRRQAAGEAPAEGVATRRRLGER